MPISNFKILPVDLLARYCQEVDERQLLHYKNLKDSELSIKNFSFYTSVSAVFSSKIEGEDIELDSYIKHKRFGIQFKPDYTRKIDDLYNAYLFAQKNPINEVNIGQAHQLLTKNILPKNRQGKIRASMMFVTTPNGKIEYVAASPFVVKQELEKFYEDLEMLVKQDLTVQEIFFFAALLHLVFVKIHPFDDGNGRAARLIEKWFLAEKIGKNAWLIESERYYYANHATYYKNIRALGLEYETLDYTQGLPFLKMFATSLGSAAPMA